MSGVSREAGTSGVTGDMGAESAGRESWRVRQILCHLAAVC